MGFEAFQALTAERALLNKITELTKTNRDNIEDKLSEALDELKAAQRKLGALQAAALAEKLPSVLAAAKVVGSTRLAIANFGQLGSVDDLRTLTIQLRDLMQNDAAVAALFAEIDGKPMMIVAASKRAQVAGVKAGALVRVASAILGGGGGGKDDIAQGGGSNVAKIAEAINAIQSELAK